ncbi:MAG: tRNA dihydrouridine synthase DusB [Rhizobiaceae bacterium]
MQIGSVTIPNRVFLAPMSGVTDLPMRELALRHGAGLVVAEMVPGAELAKGKPESRRRIRRAQNAVHMVQLAGREPGLLAEGARVAAGEGADIIDINMGCPAKKVTGGYCGSALMRDPDLASRLINAVIEAVDVPVTVKMRLGWDENNLNAPEIASRAQSLGARMITVHGRTRSQFYKGSANWAAIADIKSAIDVPLVVNGDISCLNSAKSALSASGADAVMVGRAHYGAPWAAGTIALEANDGNHGEMPSESELAGYVAAHYKAMLSLYGCERGVRHARKHLGWYMDRHLGVIEPETRSRMMTATDHNLVLSLIRKTFSVIPGYKPFRRAA